MLTQAQVAALQADLLGPVILPSDPQYDEARRVFNAMSKYDPTNFFRNNQNIAAKAV
jgi:hypothetical protein